MTVAVVIIVVLTTVTLFTYKEIFSLSSLANEMPAFILSNIILSILQGILSYCKLSVLDVGRVVFFLNFIITVDIQYVNFRHTT